MQKLQTVEVAATENPDGSVIWLHGLGADGHDFEAIVPEMNLPADLDLRFVFPHAPVRPVTLNGGMAMRAWYDIFSLDRGGPVDEEGIRQSAAILGSLVEQEHDRGVPYANIVVAGFSQGGAIASHFALRFSQRLAGLMALSTYLPLQGTLQAEVSDADKAQPADLRIFMAHVPLRSKMVTGHWFELSPRWQILGRSSGQVVKKKLVSSFVPGEMCLFNMNQDKLPFLSRWLYLLKPKIYKEHYVKPTNAFNDK